MTYRPADWMANALCAAENHELFFPAGRPSNKCRNLCGACPVREQCLERALSSPWEPVGIWGGLGPRQLMPLWRERHPAHHGEAHRALGIGVA
jgi:WhiB family redox-sensing transcriptional regulator